jgi:hypothetical protein
VGHAGVDQARLLAAGDDLDRVAQRGLRAQQEGVAVARLAQRLRGHGAHLPGSKPARRCGEAPQAGQAALRGLFGQQAVGVEAGAQAHGLLEVVDAAVAAVLQLPDLQPEAVGAHVDGGQRPGGGASSVVGMRDWRPHVPGGSRPAAPRMPTIRIAASPQEETPMTADFDTLVPATGDFGFPSRRDFVRTSVGSGFAAAVLPVMAQTVVKTDSPGLVAGEVTIPVGDFKMPAYRAAPAGKPNAPVVLVVSEIFGVHEYIADVARRFAKAGYFAIAPELFVRQGDASSYGEIAKLIAEVISKVPDAQVMADLDATVAWAKGQGADTGKLASPASAGAAASPGCTARTTRR